MRIGPGLGLTSLGRTGGGPPFVSGDLAFAEDSGVLVLTSAGSATHFFVEGDGELEVQENPGSGWWVFREDNDVLELVEV